MKEQKPHALDLAAFERFLVTAMVELTAAEQTLNSLNVYPVPDGDTGSNLRSTWEAFFHPEHSRKSGEKPQSEQDAVRAGLRRLTAGARGNAGVIVSEYVRGCSTLLRFDEGRLRQVDGDRIARMLHAGAAAARVAVDQPVEGTVLSVADAAAAAGAQARSAVMRAGDTVKPADILDAAVLAATDALKRSPQQLAVLAGAGVVDSGGAGLLFLLEAWARVAGGRHGLPRGKDRSWLNVAPRHGFAADQVCQVSQTGPAFEFMAVAEGLDETSAANLRRELSGCGDSVVVAGGDGMHRIHVHTDDVLGAASLARAHANLMAPTVTRFAGELEQLRAIHVDVVDDVVRTFAQACGFATQSERRGASVGASAKPTFLITDGMGQRQDELKPLGGSSAVHAVATIEACVFEAAIDEAADFLEVAQDASFLTVESARTWAEGEDQVRTCLDGAEQLVVLIDPDADPQAAASFDALVAGLMEDTVVLRVASGALLQIGFE